MADFDQTQLAGASLQNPTSLQFGPDGRLYVSQVNGLIKAFTIATTSTGGYSVTSTETIGLINQMPNHNDDGTFNPSLTGRQVTGILVTGTAQNPVIYVSSSDPRIGAGTSLLDTGLDTNSGILSCLTKTDTGWVKEDLVVGLPRSEENHGVNGIQIDPATGHLLLTVGGNTNVGAPSAEFAYLPEYAYSSSIVDIDLQAVSALPSQIYRGQTYKYVLPTVDDPTRAGADDVVAVGQPEVFGGNDGLNQARVTADSPVKIYATGFRNIYDLVFTTSGSLYGIDNGGNPTWGGTPIYQQANGTFSTTPTSEVTNRINNGSGSLNVAPLHRIEQGYYGGHANPIRANPDGAGLYDENNNPIQVPGDWPPVPLSMANPVEGYYLPPGANRASILPSELETPLFLRDALTTFPGSVNGIDDYRSNAFNGEMRGDLVATSLNQDAVFRIDLSSDGRTAQDVINLTPNGVLGGGTPLDVHAAPESGPFGGTLWVANYGGNITILKPGETTSPPPSTDYDADGLSDVVDRFGLDPANGTATVLQGNGTLTWGFSQNQPFPGPADTLFNIGFTGVMTNLTQSFKAQYDPTRVVAGGAASGILLQNITEGSAAGTTNSQLDAYQLGIMASPDVEDFVITARVNNPFETTTPANFQNVGFFIGTGDQSNYIKLVAGANTVNGAANSPSIQAVFESNNQTVAQQLISAPSLFGGSLSFTTLDDITLKLAVDPDLGIVTPSWSFTRGRTSTSAGTVFNGTGDPIQASGALLQALKGTYEVSTSTGAQLKSGLAIGLISTSAGPGVPFDATWNSVSVTATSKPQTASGVAKLTMTPNGPIDVSTFDPNTFRLENLAQSQSNLQRVIIDLTNAILPDGIFFDPNAAGGSSGKPFTIDTKTGTFTAVAQYREGSASQGYKQLILDFTDFNPGEALGFSIDIDPESLAEFGQTINAGGISGAEAARSRVTYIFADGTQQNADLFGTGVGQADARSQSIQGAAPTVTIGGVSSGNVSIPSSGATAEELSTAIVSGRPGATVRVQTMLVEQQAVSSSNPFQGNAATSVSYQNVTLDAEGKGTVQVNLATGRVTVVAVAEVDANGFVISAVSSEVRAIRQGSTSPGAPPVNTVPGAQTAQEDQAYAIAGLTVADPDSTSLTTTLSVAQGTLTVSGSSGVSGNGTARVTLTGSASAINTALAGLSYKGNLDYSGPDTLTVTTSDGVLQDVDTVAITVQASASPGRVAINTGGGAYTDAAGIVYAVDTASSPHPTLKGSSTVKSITAPIGGTSNDGLYQSYRYGTDFGYDVALANGSYTVQFQFTEPWVTGAGQRVFDVLLEGTTVVDNLDLFTVAGKNNAYAVTKAVTVTDGLLNVRLDSIGVGEVDNAILSGLVIQPGSPGASTTSANQDLFLL